MLDAARSALAARKLVPTRDRAIQALAICGRILTIPSPSLNADGRARLYRDADAIAVDMETHWLVATATDFHLPWLAVRAVSDAANARLPASIASWRDEHDDWRVARGIALQPQGWLAAARLIRDTGLALRSLSRAVAAITAALEGIAPSAYDA
jgi:hypothetical protein